MSDAWADPGWVDDEAIGKWLRGQVTEHCGLEEDEGLLAQVARLARRLNRVRFLAPALEPVLLFSAAPTAFVGPGRTLYLTRGLMHQARSEDAVAFAMAHEMAHHDLGHTRCFGQRMVPALLAPGALGVALFLAWSQRWMNGPEREAAADRRGLEMCLAAGFDRARCLELFDLLETYCLDHGDIDIVFGPDTLPDTAASASRRWLAKAGTWAWQRARGYHSLQERRRRLLAPAG